ncbi:hypothetical protein HMPREF2580_04290 [Staphylococcus sp. HMSC036D05]|uniref:hypothetical protein n=1 Tax=Staphylococcus sp. HMSC036D05 TaxID=1715059 RepID=UPI0008A8996D|nr:hypothetical protein [Staphylococcus sp. HMSC036D05]OHO72534.1 hypothetical protein HMPREF2580_04290 [Staphylococcus sp. HMSC036D05]
MTSKVDEFNHLIVEKKEQVDNLLVEKKHVNDLMNEYQDMIQTTEKLNRHLVERYYESRMLSSIEQNSDIFRHGQQQALNALQDQQSKIDKDIQYLNRDITEIERKRNIELQIEHERGKINEH